MKKRKKSVVFSEETGEKIMQNTYKITKKRPTRAEFYDYFDGFVPSNASLYSIAIKTRYKNPKSKREKCVLDKMTFSECEALDLIGYLSDSRVSADEAPGLIDEINDKLLTK